jgi:hypothetical protein
MLRTAQVSPFEARGQVFVIASAETLSGEAANALLKNLEEPYVTAPRNFLLLAPSRLDLLPTLRSRSLAVFLGPAAAIDAEATARLAGGFGAALRAYLGGGAVIHLLAAADALAAAGGWEDPRSGRPWALAAAAVLRAVDPHFGARQAPGPAAPAPVSPAPALPARTARSAPKPPADSAAAGELPPRARRACLALAEALLAAPPWRLRGITAERILEGLVARHLAALGPA